MTLAQLGADVIRIDPIGGATDFRRLPLDGNANSLYWSGLNKSKRSVEINLASEEGQSLVKALLSADEPEGGILLTNAVSLPWLSYEELVECSPNLIMVHIKGLSDGSPAVDYTVNAQVGLPLVTGPADSRAPVNHVLPAWDLLTGLHAAMAIITAERVRRSTGEGQSISVALADVAVATMCHLGFVADVHLNGEGRAREGNYLYGSFGCDFQTADGGRVMVVALTARHWQKIVGLTGLEATISALERSLDTDLKSDNSRYDNREILAALIRPWFAQRQTNEVVAALEDARILWGEYQTIEEFVLGPDSLLARSSLIHDVDHPGIGVIPTPNPVLELAGVDRDSPRPAPPLGGHTDDVLRELLGLGEGTLAELRAAGVIGGPAQ